jgi:hypothetical protein
MNSLEFFLALFWMGLVVFLLNFLSRRLARDAVRLEEREPGRLGEIVYLSSKWLTIILGLLLALVYLPSWWPPRWWERHEQRKEVNRRIETVGGWSNLVADAATFLSTNTLPSDAFYPHSQTNVVLPASFAALKPSGIRYEKLGGVNSVRLHLFGMRSTGERGTAFYWLLVFPDGLPTNGTDLLTQRAGGKRAIRRITEGVFEVY